MSRKRNQRVAEITKEYDNYMVQATEEAIVASKEDVDLFVIDTVGSKSARRKVNKEVKKQESGVVSATDAKLVAKRLAQKTASTPTTVAVTEPAAEVYDLWDTPAPQAPASRSTKGGNSKKLVVRGGQSYNPSVDDHQDALAEAHAVELKHQEELARKNAAFDTTSTALISSLDEIGDSDDDEVELDSGVVATVSSVSRRKKEKLTIAQRNKIRRRNIKGFEEAKLQAEKRLEDEVDKLPHILRELAAAEQLKEQQKALKQIQNQVDNMDTMSYEEVSQVPLTDELHGNLRSIIPKGNVLLDRVQNMVKNEDMVAKNRRSRRNKEKPHGEKKVKWIAKYKYV